MCKLLSVFDENIHSIEKQLKEQYNYDIIYNRYGIDEANNHYETYYTILAPKNHSQDKIISNVKNILPDYFWRYVIKEYNEVDDNDKRELFFAVTDDVFDK